MTHASSLLKFQATLPAELRPLGSVCSRRVSDKRSLTVAALMGVLLLIATLLGHCDRAFGLAFQMDDLIRGRRNQIVLVR